MTVTFLTTEDSDSINIKLGQLQETIDKFIGQLEVLNSTTEKLKAIIELVGDLKETTFDSYKNRIIKEYLETLKKKRKTKKKV